MSKHFFSFSNHLFACEIFPDETDEHTEHELKKKHDYVKKMDLVKAQ